MTNLLFLAAIAAIITLLFNWSFRSLQKERWQIFGTIPHHKGTDGTWQGTNFTYYGIFTAIATTFACAIGLVLLGSQVVALTTMMILAAAVLIPCFAAAKLVARLVEKKSATFSVAGASFIGILLAPWLIYLLQRMHRLDLEIISALAVLSIAYTFGESLGRLACISFGCCYGKRISDLPPWLGRLIKRFSFVFSGELKKISYAHHLDGQAVIPIQGITSVIYAFTGIAGIYLFLSGFHTAAFLLTATVTQCWRLMSEFFRADFRGNGKISVYQLMGGFSVMYCIGIALLLPIGNIPAGNLAQGLELFWNPGVILFLELLWIFTFIYTGRSQVTGATLVFSVRTHKI